MDVTRTAPEMVPCSGVCVNVNSTHVMCRKTQLRSRLKEEAMHVGSLLRAARRQSPLPWTCTSGGRSSASGDTRREREGLAAQVREGPVSQVRMLSASQ